MTDRDHITAELRAVFDGQDIKDDAIAAVARFVLADADRWRKLLEMDESDALHSDVLHPDCPHCMCEAGPEILCTACGVGFADGEQLCPGPGGIAVSVLHERCRPVAVQEVTHA